ncbi:MAG: hypothetical protein GY928_11395 [Colwellia sp.]|nr:hypothetical protein [Colwellia sp.]
MVISEKELKVVKVTSVLVASILSGYGINGLQKNDTLKTIVETQRKTDDKQNELIQVLNDRSLRNDERQKAIFKILEEIKNDLKRKN